MHGVHAVRPLNGLPASFRSHQAHGHMDPADNQNTFFGLDFTPHFGGKLAVAGINLTRFQRASKSAHHSTSGGSDDIVDRGSV